MNKFTKGQAVNVPNHATVCYFVKYLPVVTFRKNAKPRAVVTFGKNGGEMTVFVNDLSAKVDADKVVKTFKFHAVRNAEAMNIISSATSDEVYNQVVSSANYDYNGCHNAPVEFLQALRKAFGEFMQVDAVESVCNRLHSANGVLSFR